MWHPRRARSEPDWHSRCQQHAVSSVRRCGKYHSVPLAFWMASPENIVAKRSIGVSAPAPFQPWVGPWETRPWPRCAWAASKLDGDVVRSARSRTGQDWWRTPEERCPWAGGPMSGPSEGELGSKRQLPIRLPRTFRRRAPRSRRTQPGAGTRRVERLELWVAA